MLQVGNEVSPEIYRLIVERDIAYYIWDKEKTDDNRDRFLPKELYNHYVTLAPQSTRGPTYYFNSHSCHRTFQF
jgi:hypothetical protein